MKPPRGKSPTRQSCYGGGASWGILAKETKTPAPMDDQSIYSSAECLGPYKAKGPITFGRKTVPHIGARRGYRSTA